MPQPGHVGPTIAVAPLLGGNRLRLEAFLSASLLPLSCLHAPQKALRAAQDHLSSEDPTLHAGFRTKEANPGWERPVPLVDFPACAVGGRKQGFLHDGPREVFWVDLGRPHKEKGS